MKFGLWTLKMAYGRKIYSGVEDRTPSHAACAESLARRRAEPTDSLAVGISILAAIVSEKIDLKVSRSIKC